ncbi:MAG: C_GCAxxG_C_C family protein [Oscillospiraceae bacterium]|nr:C_GCAxxG_C_C family protein [Oscillospiraceae bacterium]
MKLGEIAGKYYLEEKLNCAVSVLMGANEVYGLGLTMKDAKLITGFGGGIGCGNLCGALAGAVSAMGRILLTEDEMYSPALHDACAGFVSAFTEKWGTTLCAPIKEMNVTSPETRCVKTVVETGNLLQEYIDGILRNR